jgi:hypothetical protein
MHFSGVIKMSYEPRMLTACGPFHITAEKLQTTRIKTRTKPLERPLGCVETKRHPNTLVLVNDDDDDDDTVFTRVICALFSLV